MASVTAIIDAVLAHIVTADATITTLNGSIAEEDLRKDQIPHAQAFLPSRDTVEESEVWRQELVNYAFTVLINTRDKTQTQLEAILTAIETQLATDPTLADTVDWCRIGSYTISDVADGATGYQAMIFEVIAEKWI